MAGVVCPNVSGGSVKVSRLTNLDNRIGVRVVGNPRGKYEISRVYSFIIPHRVWAMQPNVSRPPRIGTLHSMSAGILSVTKAMYRR
jgi:hypothetical protein